MELLDDDAIGSRACMMYAYLSIWSIHSDGEIHATPKVIAEYSGLSLRAVSKAIGALRKRGAIIKDEHCFRLRWALNKRQGNVARAYWYGKVPIGLFSAQEITDTARRVYAILSAHSVTLDSVFRIPSAKIAALMGFSESAFNEHKRQLVRAGFLRHTGRDGDGIRPLEVLMPPRSEVEHLAAQRLWEMEAEERAYFRALDRKTRKQSGNDDAKTGGQNTTSPAVNYPKPGGPYYIKKRDLKEDLNSRSQQSRSRVLVLNEMGGERGSTLENELPPSNTYPRENLHYATPDFSAPHRWKQTNPDEVPTELWSLADLASYFLLRFRKTYPRQDHLRPREIMTQAELGKLKRLVLSLQPNDKEGAAAIQAAMGFARRLVDHAFDHHFRITVGLELQTKMITPGVILGWRLSLIEDMDRRQIGRGKTALVGGDPFPNGIVDELSATKDYGL